MTKLPFYKIVEERLMELGLSANQASLLATNGRNRDFIRKLKTASGPPEITNLYGLAEVLGWQPDVLMKAYKTGERPATRAEALANFHLGDQKYAAESSHDVADVPVLGMAQGSAIGSFVIGEPIDRVKRPPALYNARNIYALYVHGESMTPRFMPGDLLFVSADRPAGQGDSVIIQTCNYEGGPIESYVKILERRTPDAVFARQFKPDATIEFKADHVIAVHKVLTIRELFGV